MKENNQFDILGTIKKVNAPPYLYKKIEERINAITSEMMPKGFMLASSIAFIILLFFNMFLVTSIIRIEPSRNDNVEVIAEGMHLTISNQLYYDE